MQKNRFPRDHEDPFNNKFVFSKLKSEVVRYFSKWFLNKWWVEDAVEIAVARLPGCSSIQASNNLKQIPSARKRCLWKNQSVATLPELWFSGKRIPPSHNHFLHTRIIFKFSWFWHHGNVLIFATLRLVCYTFGRKNSKSEVQKVIDLQISGSFSVRISRPNPLLMAPHVR